MMKSRINISQNIAKELTDAIASCRHDRLFILTDETTHRLCWPVLDELLHAQEAKVITIPASASMAGIKQWRRHETFLSCESWWWNGDRFRGLCSFNFQAGHQLHQYSNNAFSYG